MSTAKKSGLGVWRSVSVAAVAAVVAIASLSREATASLVSLSSSFGADTITLDTATNLEWLDLPLTLDLSINAVTAQLQPGGTYDGFRYASSSEIATLFTDAGLPIGSTTNPVDVPLAQTLLGLLGQTGTEDSVSGPVPLAAGWESDTTGIAGPGFNYTATLAIQPPGQPPDGVCLPAGCVTAEPQSSGESPGDGTPTSPIAGSFLVRAVAAPEPATLALLGIGLAGLGFSRRRKC